MSFCNGNFQKRISRVEISRNFNGNFQGENFHFGNFHSLLIDTSDHSVRSITFSYRFNISIRRLPVGDDLDLVRRERGDVSLSIMTAEGGGGVRGSAV